MRGRIRFTVDGAEPRYSRERHGVRGRRLARPSGGEAMTGAG